MRTTQDIKKKLDSVLAELERINTYLLDHPEATVSSRFVFKDGKTTHGEWTFNDAITSLVAEKLILKWVLNINS